MLWGQRCVVVEVGDMKWGGVENSFEKNFFPWIYFLSLLYIPLDRFWFCHLVKAHRRYGLLVWGEWRVWVTQIITI